MGDSPWGGLRENKQTQGGVSLKYNRRIAEK